MITIKKGDIERTVTKGAFENLYKKMGFELVNNKPVKDEKKVKDVVVEEEIVDEKDDIIPPMKDDKDELKNFILNDLTSTKSKSKKD